MSSGYCSLKLSKSHPIQWADLQILPVQKLFNNIVLITLMTVILWVAHFSKVQAICDLTEEKMTETLWKPWKESQESLDFSLGLGSTSRSWNPMFSPRSTVQLSQGRESFFFPSRSIEEDVLANFFNGFCYYSANGSSYNSDISSFRPSFCSYCPMSSFYVMTQCNVQCRMSWISFEAIGNSPQVPDVLGSISSYTDRKRKPEISSLLSLFKEKPEYSTSETNASLAEW